MTEDRRYQDEEIRAIFGAAAEAADPVEHAISAGEGLTLAHLQEIGREVGIPAERIAAAARALDQRPAPIPRRTYMGMPVAVGRTVELPRAPTDREWALLVSELRETFRARGRVESSPDFREWANGNLHAMVEPTETGYRLRLGTRKQGAAAGATAVVAAVGYSFLMLGITLVTGHVPGELIGPGIAVAGAGAALGSGFLRLPAWARKREAQMEYIAARAQALIGPKPLGSD
jgi:hypothetical protein